MLVFKNPGRYLDNLEEIKKTLGNPENSSPKLWKIQTV